MKHPILTAAVLLIAASAATAQTVPAGFADSQYGAANITSATAMAWAPDGRLFVCQQTGALRVVKNGTLLGTPFHTATVNSTGERGLLGVAFDPDFAGNGYVYIYYTTTTSIHNCIRRIQASAPGSDVSTGGETVIADFEALTATNHNGGAMHFNPLDGKLYVAVGENAVGSNSQSITNRLGKILRYNPDGTIPADNPATISGLGSPAGVNRAIWAAGLRNPFTFAFQPGTGRMFINDVGQGTWEEVNDGIAGSNYGWPTTEGDFTQASFPNFSRPIHAYMGNPRAITGGAFYNPSVVQFPAAYVGRYFYAEYVQSWMSWIDPASPGTATQFATNLGNPVDIQIGPDGALYYLARGGAAPGVHRIAYTGVATQNIIVSTNQLSVTEGGSAIVNVRLAINPGAAYTVNVANTVGSSTVTVGAPTVNFTTGNWNVDQPITVNAAADGDAIDNSASVTFSGAGVASQNVVVTVLDTNGVAMHPTARIALPVNGQTVSGASAEFFGNGTPMSPATMTQAQFFVDGVSIYTDANTSGHYHVSAGHNGWNTTTLANGFHVLRMTVTDSSARVGSHEVTVLVSNSSGGGGGGGGGCGGTGLEAPLLMGLAAILNRKRRR